MYFFVAFCRRRSLSHQLAETSSFYLKPKSLNVAFFFLMAYLFQITCIATLSCYLFHYLFIRVLCSVLILSIHLGDVLIGLAHEHY